MTERKPPEISFASWIDQQINEAAERGALITCLVRVNRCPGGERPTMARPGCGTNYAGRACRPRSSCRPRCGCAKRSSG